MRNILLAFLLFSVSLQGQKKVSDLCAPYKMRTDSMMRAAYGDSLFEKYFVFDTNSVVRSKAYDYYMWNDTFPDDSIWYGVIGYKFVYPGAQSGFLERFHLRSEINGISIEPPATYGNRCLQLQPEQIAISSEQHIGKPLKKCNVRLYRDDEYYFSSDTQQLDSNHVYLLVEFRRQVGRRRYGRHFVRYRVVVVDACTGEVFGKRRRIYTYKHHHGF